QWGNVRGGMIPEVRGCSITRRTRFPRNVWRDYPEVVLAVLKAPSAAFLQWDCHTDFGMLFNWIDKKDKKIPVVCPFSAQLPFFILLLR
ncbi:MAG: hypothetical protein OIF34_06350, partial [Porticoccaceae bacterium]|nr:hypothetical protein [Porticoccaceae bacterium]